MKPDTGRLRFFLGVNTPQGFVSRFDQLTAPLPGVRAWLLKGGPGNGKSTILSRVAAALEQAGDEVEYIHCAARAKSLDAVVAPGRQLSVVDATAPHALEPRYPGAVETVVDLSACWDAGALFERREEIIELTGRAARCHDYSCRFLGAAAALLGDNYRIALACVGMPKLSAYLGRLAEREFKRKGEAGAGREQVRFLTAVTDEGQVKLTDTAKALAQRIYLVNDDYGAISRMMLCHARSRALAAGYDVISCYCPLAPYEKLEQLFIPELRLGFMTSNRFHDFSAEIDPYRIINCQRFTDDALLKESKRRLSFNRKAAAQMVHQAQVLIADAAALHARLEEIYAGATDFKKVDAITEKLVRQLTAES